MEYPVRARSAAMASSWRSRSWEGGTAVGRLQSCCCRHCSGKASVMLLPALKWEGVQSCCCRHCSGKALKWEGFSPAVAGTAVGSVKTSTSGLNNFMIIASLLDTVVGQNNWNTTIFSTLSKNLISSKILIQVSLFWYIFPVNRLFLLLNCVFSIIFQI